MSDANNAPGHYGRSEAFPPEPVCAMFAERGLIERDGAISIIRIVDSIIAMVPPSEIDEDDAGVRTIRGGASAVVNVALVLRFPVRQDLTSLAIRVTGYSPNGGVQDFADEPIELTPGHERVQFVMDIEMRINVLGVHRFVVRIGEDYALTLPLRVDLASTSSTPAATAGNPSEDQ